MTVWCCRRAGDTGSFKSRAEEKPGRHVTCLRGRLRHAGESVRLQGGAEVEIKIDSPETFVEAQRTVDPRSFPWIELTFIIRLPVPQVGVNFSEAPGKPDAHVRCGVAVNPLAQLRPHPSLARH